MSGSGPTTYRVEHDVIERCRSCRSDDLKTVIAFGDTPLADRLLSSEQLVEPEPRCPLTVTFCHDCTLLQLRETVAPESLFNDKYPYYSSVSRDLRRHFRGTVDAARRYRSVDRRSLVMEIASNDGYLLRHYRDDGIPVLGIDPSKGPVEVARDRGIDTVLAFFTEQLAGELRARGVRADIVHANNILAHVADTNGFVAGLATILADDGLIVVECPYVRDLIDQGEFDTIYHQHLCYFSLRSLDGLFSRHGLHVNDVEHIAVHGGSLRLFIGKRPAPSERLRRLRQLEAGDGLGTIDHYRGFAEKIATNRERVVRLLDALKAGGQRIVGYGAPAKACTLMAYMGIGDNYLDYLVDKNPAKQGLHYPGNRLRILPPEQLLEDQPDCALLLPWNLVDEILDEQSVFLERGGAFLVPIPVARLVSNHPGQ